MRTKISIMTPAGKGAKVKLGTGDTVTMPAGALREFTVPDGGSVTVYDAESIDENSITDESGGGGHGDPDNPGGR